MIVIRPPLLEAGDTVGIVSLGSPIASSTVMERIETLEEIGLRVTLGESVFLQDGFLAGTAEERAQDFMRMVVDENIKMILPTRGGVGVKGILPFLDYRLIAENPKIIVGYSDVTVLLNTLYYFSNLITFHGLMLIDFQMSTPSFNFNEFFRALSTLEAPRNVNNPDGMPLIGRVPGIVTGEIIGGNLTSFIGTLGTPFEMDTRGKILIIEETNEPINTVYRYLKQLELAGKLRDVAGIVMGECTGCGAAYGVTYDDLIEQFLVPLNKPLLTGLATGHGIFKTTFPIGAMATLDGREGTLTLHEPSVSFSF